MFGTRLARSLIDSRKIAVLIGATLALALAASRADTASASASFVDNITVKGTVTCDAYVQPVRNFRLYFAAYATNWGPDAYQAPYAPTYVWFQVIDNRTGQPVFTSAKTWLWFVGMSPTWTLGPYNDGIYRIQAYYARVINGVWSPTNTPDLVGAVAYSYGVLTRCVTA
jgi:hypothetical protein